MPLEIGGELTLERNTRETEPKQQQHPVMDVNSWWSKDGGCKKHNIA